jgi:hypothetical protein
MSSSFLSIDEQIAAVNKQIDKVENEIDAVAQAVNEAEAAGNDRKVDRLSEKEKQLREKEKQLREEKIILLKQQQQQPQPSDTNLAAAIQQLQISQQEAAERQQEAAERQQEAAERQHKEAERQSEQLSRLASAFASSPTPIPNAALVGQVALSKLRKTNSVHRIDVRQGRAAVLEQENDDLTSTKDEHVVVALLMPLLRNVFAPSGRVVCNGENLRWPEIVHVSPRMPDIVISLPQFLQRKLKAASDKTKPAVSKARAADPDLIYGIPFTASLSGNAVHEAEAKLDIGDPSSGDTGNVGLGELKNYMLARIAAMELDNVKRKIANLPVLPSPLFLRSLLFGRKYFWLLTMDAEGGTFSELSYGQWTDCGSVDVIREFFELLPWENAVKRVFSDLASSGIAPFDHFAVGSSVDHSFLGQGGMGRVFRGVMSDKSLVAVKVVLPSNVSQLEKEFQLLKSLESKSLPLVKPCSNFVGDVEYGAGYAMQPIGRSLRGADFAGKSELLNRVFRSLFQLHFAGVAHGDARLANLLVVDDDHLVWADLSAADEHPGEFAFLHDVQTLIKSCIGDADAADTKAQQQYSREVVQCEKQDEDTSFNLYMVPIVVAVASCINKE